MLTRITEPELMESEAQVDAYASIDFTESHGRIIEQLVQSFPGNNFAGQVLNLGCGSGDDMFRFMQRFPLSEVTGIDGSANMIERARSDLNSKFSEFLDRAHFITAYIPSPEIPIRDYVGIMSNSLLHHMHDPDGLWKTIANLARPGCAVFVGDLRRPPSLDAANALVEMHAPGVPEVFRNDFFNSLCAAFTVDEVRSQLERANLSELQVREIGDRHLIVSGTKL